MQSVEKGYFTLDTDINAIVPFSVRNPRFPDAPITIRQLATHTSSVIDRAPFYDDSDFEGSQTSFDIREFLQSYLTPGSPTDSTENFTTERPGVAYEYSNLAPTLAALAVETKARTNYAQYSQTHILTPLHMDASGWSPAQTKGRVATLYDDHMSVITPYSFPSYPDGGLYTSCSDLGKLLAAMIRGYQGQSGIISAAFFHKMFLPQYPKHQQPKNSVPGNGLGEGILWQRPAGGGMGVAGRDLGAVARMGFNPSTGSGRILVTHISGFKTSPKSILEEVNRIWSTLAPSANASKIH